MKGYKHMFYVVHSPDRGLENKECNDGNINILCARKISQLAINAGLANWVIGKTS